MLRDIKNKFRKSENYTFILKGKMYLCAFVIHTKSNRTQYVNETIAQNQVYSHFPQLFEEFNRVSITGTDGDKENFTLPIKPGRIEI